MVAAPAFAYGTALRKNTKLGCSAPPYGASSALNVLELTSKMRSSFVPIRRRAAPSVKNT